jgi:hypothetical protein
MEYIKFKYRGTTIPPTYSGVDPEYVISNSYFVWTGASGTVFPEQALTSRLCLRGMINWDYMSPDEINDYNTYLEG